MDTLQYYDLCIVGGGSIGGIIAYYSFRGGITSIPVYYRSIESIEAIMKNGGLTIKYGDKEYLLPIIPVHHSKPIGKCRFVINTVKAYHVKDTINLMHKITDEDSLILMLQNGFGSLELVEEKMLNRYVAGGVVFIGAERINRYYILHHGGRTIIAGRRKGFTAKLLELMNILNRGGCDFRVTSNIDLYRWIKLGVNAVINPLTAITRSKNKIVLTQYGRILAEKIIDELIIAAEKYGFKLDKKKLLTTIFRGAKNTSENYSSMAQDIMNNKPTEIDYINGFIAKHVGEKSVNEVITLIVHLIEESYMKNH
ncbi:ketopantoate reductase family protein [Staphylothermus hellenicus]|uniref:ketopantoate reductase family protein n=1 Tax=Staphylothermus hellenicus TaxID=84599 RepID=UPI003CCAD3BF